MLSRAQGLLAATSARLLVLTLGAEGDCLLTPHALSYFEGLRSTS